MQSYELKLYKITTSSQSVHEEVGAYLIEAADDEAAIEIAKNTQIPIFDNSDYAILYGPKMRFVEKWTSHR